MNETYAMTLDDVEFDAPLHQVGNGIDIVPADEAQVFITLRAGWQEGHTHWLLAPTKHGDSSCITCGAQAWAPDWVRAGVYGDNTEQWVSSQVRAWGDMAMTTSRLLLERGLGVVSIDGVPTIPLDNVVLAMLNADQPAKQFRDRPGLPVPAMRHLEGVE